MGEIKTGADREFKKKVTLSALSDWLRAKQARWQASGPVRLRTQTIPAAESDTSKCCLEAAMIMVVKTFAIWKHFARGFFSFSADTK